MRTSTPSSTPCATSTPHLVGRGLRNLETGLLTEPGHARQSRTRPRPPGPASFPVPFGGGSFEVQSEAVDRGGQHDRNVGAGAASSSTASAIRRNTTVTNPTDLQILRFPNDVRQSFPVIVQRHRRRLRRQPPGHPGGPRRHQEPRARRVLLRRTRLRQPAAPEWVARYRAPAATLASPNAVSTAWSISVPMYSHPHSYSVTAWAVDSDGQVEQSRPTITWCVRDTGDNSCP